MSEPQKMPDSRSGFAFMSTKGGGWNKLRIKNTIIAIPKNFTEPISVENQLMHIKKCVIIHSLVSKTFLDVETSC